MACGGCARRRAKMAALLKKAKAVVAPKDQKPIAPGTKATNPISKNKNG